MKNILSPRSGLIQKQETAGFSLIEQLIIVAFMGILAAIAYSSWSGFLERQRLSIAQSRAAQAVRQTQATARQRDSDMRVSFQNINGIAHWASHSASASATTLQWQILESSVRIDESGTTLQRSNGIYRVEFDHRGNVDGQLGRLTLASANTSSRSRVRRCVVVSTLLGAIRLGQETSSGNRNCN